jgi:hypothetical protein
MKPGLQESMDPGPLFLGCMNKTQRRMPLSTATTHLPVFPMGTLLNIIRYNTIAPR